MKNINLLSKISNHIHLKRGGKFLGFGVSAYTDWKIIFVSFVVLVSAVIVVCVAVFLRIDKGEIFEIKRSEVAKENSLDINLLRSTTSYYQAKEKEFERITNLRTASSSDSVSAAASTTRPLVSPFGQPQ